MVKEKRMNKKPVLVMVVILMLISLGSFYIASTHQNDVEAYQVEGLPIQHQFLTINPYSRSGKSLHRVNGIVIHYTANPGSTAKNNRNYFENLRYTKTTSVSSHFIIGLDGEIIQCIPLNEIAYASNNRNRDTISIECCHPDESGKFNEETYNSLVKLVRALMKTYHLQSQDVIRHYDVTGKICPKYFVEHEDQWKEFLNTL
ncbi:N-acetylmuramoyl-L-alanine amidase [Clostridium sp. C1]|uniref:peptidoglycan recognition protein family protein n=1 Tax=Clostridium sp. C1 TaxID=1155388 RepID=UPI001BAC92B5|nr:peptidoglycan recognition family protein [Clostridium sp. C1]QUN12352.1 N-acetylmuramoyl-L-alanine amidase [Clostridium sp. C1]